MKRRIASRASSSGNPPELEDFCPLLSPVKWAMPDQGGRIAISSSPRLCCGGAKERHALQSASAAFSAMVLGHVLEEARGRADHR